MQLILIALSNPNLLKRQAVNQRTEIKSTYKTIADLVQIEIHKHRTATIKINMRLMEGKQASMETLSISG